MGAIVIVVNLLSRERRSLPPLQLVSGALTTLERLAMLALSCAGSKAKLIAGEPRNFDVRTFVGDPSAAEKALGWRTTTTIEQGIKKLVEAFVLRDRS